MGEKGHVKPANYLDSHEKFLIGVATKGGTELCLMYVLCFNLMLLLLLILTQIIFTVLCCWCFSGQVI